MPAKEKKSTRKKSKKVTISKKAYTRKYVPREKSTKYDSMSSHAKKFGHGLVDLGVDKIGSIFKNILGSGAYEIPAIPVKNNTLMNLQDQIPEMHSNGQTSTRMRHREYLQDIVTSATPGAFKLESFEINPGNFKSFPWLSEIAGGNYQKWRPNGIVFEFRTMSGDALTSTNTALGSVIMSSNYDSVEGNFRNKYEMENTEFAASCKPSMSMLHPIECAPKQSVLNGMYVQNGSETGTFDKRLDVLCNFQIATVGMQGASVNVGELWVTYDIELIAPIQQAPLSQAKTSKLSIDYANVTPTTLFGTSALPAVGVPVTDYSTQKYNLINNVGAIFSNNQFRIPRGNVKQGEKYTWYYSAYGASTASVTPLSFSSVVGVFPLTGFRNFVATQINAPPTASTASNIISIGEFSVDGSNNDVILNFQTTTLPTDITSVDFACIQTNSISVTI